jgi:hypothetical protein
LFTSKVGFTSSNGKQNSTSFGANLQEKDHSGNLDVNYIKIDFQEVGNDVNYLQLLCYGCLSCAK